MERFEVASVRPRRSFIGNSDSAACLCQIKAKGFSRPNKFGSICISYIAPAFACITGLSAIVPQSTVKIAVEVFGNVFEIQARATADIAGHRIQQA